MATSADQFVELLARRTRVLMLGGLAMIAHGLARTTKDIDIWVNPEENESIWATVIADALADVPEARVCDLSKRTTVDVSLVEEVVARDGVIRIVGLDRPVDIFRVPYNMESGDFDHIWKRATMELHNVRIPEEIDLLLTKTGTTRSQDIADVSFLEDRIRKRYEQILPSCDYEKAADVLGRYADHYICKLAMKSPDIRVRNLALNILKQFAADGDPYAREIINGNR